MTMIWYQSPEVDPSQYNNQYSLLGNKRHV